jgi:hypothetical protein
VSTGGAEHCAVMPPLAPVQVHDQGPVPATADAVPAVQSPVVGAAVKSAPLDAPQVPLVINKAEQLVVVPVLAPVQVHDQGPVPLTAEDVPAEQRPVVGLLVKSAPFDAPQVPFTVIRAVQLPVVPPFVPAQVHDHGPLPVMIEAVPVVQRLVSGALLRSAPLDEPQAPFVAAPCVAQLAFVPPFVPSQAQAQGPVPLTAVAVPTLQRLVAGLVVAVVPLAEPQAPWTDNWAEQLAVVPPPAGAQVHVHGPLPLTVEAVPTEQRLAVGALVKSFPFDEPQAPGVAEDGHVPKIKYDPFQVYHMCVVPSWK